VAKISAVKPKVLGSNLVKYFFHFFLNKKLNDI